MQIVDLGRTLRDCADAGLQLLILGIAVDTGTVIAGDTLVDLGASPTWRDLEDWLKNLAGRFCHIQQARAGTKAILRSYTGIVLFLLP